MSDAVQLTAFLPFIEEAIVKALAEGALNGSLSDSIGAGKALSIREMTDEEKEAAGIENTWIDTLTGAQWKPTLTPAWPHGNPLNTKITGLTLENGNGQKTGGVVIHQKDEPGMPVLDPVADKEFIDLMNSIDEVADGKAIFDGMAQAVKDSITDDMIAAAYNDADSLNQKMADQVVKDQGVAKDKEIGKAVKKANSRADHARVSAERHEWDYCVRKSKYWPIFKNLGGTGSPGIKYIGVDKVTGSDGVEDAPPYWAWCRYPDLRKLFWVARRVNRELGACGGKKLWEALGFASKDAALKDALINNTEWQALKNTLTADVNFAASP